MKKYVNIIQYQAEQKNISKVVYFLYIRTGNKELKSLNKDFKITSFLFTQKRYKNAFKKI